MSQPLRHDSVQTGPEGGPLSGAGGTEPDPFRRLVGLMARLRAPDGCPWDAEQTHDSLKRYLVEECHEVLDAIDRRDDAELMCELGDLLLQIVFQAQLAGERRAFDIDDVCRTICDKLIRRHPHVFGDTEVTGPAEVLRNWEAIKRSEREEAGIEASRLSGVPRSLPSLARAQAIQKKAASVGFDWDDISGPLAKLREEVNELAACIKARDPGHTREELGDVLFAAVNVGRLAGLDADDCLRVTLRKFEERFAFIENAAADRGEPLGAMSIVEMDALWEQAKSQSDGV